MGDVYPGLQPVKWNEHEQKSAVVQTLCQKEDTLVNVEIQKLTDVDRRGLLSLENCLKRPSQPSIAASLQFLGASPPVLK